MIVFKLANGIAVFLSKPITSGVSWSVHVKWGLRDSYIYLSLRLFRDLLVHLPFPVRFLNRFSCFNVVYDGHFVLCYKRNFKQSWG